MFKNNKKAQVGETLTWIIATLIIIITLIIFIYASSVLPKEHISPKVNVEDEVDGIEMKISFAHFLAQNKNKELIDDWIKKENE